MTEDQTVPCLKISAWRSECGRVYSHAIIMGMCSRSWSNETAHDLSGKECRLLDTHMSQCLMLVSLFVCQCLEKHVALTLARYLEREERLLPPARYDPGHWNTCFLEHGWVEESKLVLEKNVEHSTDEMGGWWVDAATMWGATEAWLNAGSLLLSSLRAMILIRVLELMEGWVCSPVCSSPPQHQNGGDSGTHRGGHPAGGEMHQRSSFSSPEVMPDPRELNIWGVVKHWNLYFILVWTWLKFVSVLHF